jgi:hypothetical protein
MLASPCRGDRPGVAGAACSMLASPCRGDRPGGAGATCSTLKLFRYRHKNSKGDQLINFYIFRHDYCLKR